MQTHEVKHFNWLHQRWFRDWCTRQDIGSSNRHQIAYSSKRFCQFRCHLVASQQARFVRQFVHQWLATQPLQAPHLNICRGAIAITVGASLTASLCAGLSLFSFDIQTRSRFHFCYGFSNRHPHLQMPIVGRVC